MRAVIYTRYSSDNQRDASIDDQIRICKERVAAESLSGNLIKPCLAACRAEVCDQRSGAILPLASPRRALDWHLDRFATASMAL